MNPKIIAHRGYSAKFKENTLKAFKKAIEHGADALETDLQITKDKKIVLRHDFALSTGIPVCEVFFEELKNLESDIVRLEEFLTEFWETNIEFLLEIKDRMVLDALFNILSQIPKSERTDRIIICSFDAVVVRKVKEIMPELRTSLLLGTVFPLEYVIPLAKELKCDFIHLCWEARAYYPDRLLSYSDIEKVQKNGIEVILWHEERSEVLKKVLKLPVYGICTNDVSLLKLLKEEICNQQG